MTKQKKPVEKPKTTKKQSKGEMKMKSPQQLVIGKNMIVRANVAGVHAGTVVAFDGTTVTLKDARRLWRVYTRDKSGSISDVAANGLKDKADHQIGAKLPSVTIVNPNGLELAEMTDEAHASIMSYER